MRPLISFIFTLAIDRSRPSAHSRCAACPVDPSRWSCLPAGSATDGNAPHCGRTAQARRPIIIENQAGADGLFAAQAVAGGARWSHIFRARIRHTPPT